MQLNIIYGKELEIERLRKTLEKLPWYSEQGYRPRVPEGLDENSSIGMIKNVLEKDFSETVYEERKSELETGFESFAHSYAAKLIEVFGKQPPEVIEIRLTRYGVSGSYHVPNAITFNINSKDGTKTLFHEIMHLVIEEDVQKYGLLQWEKERTVDLILHSEPFAFLRYDKWQRDYHGTEIYIDPLFKEYFWQDRDTYFSEIQNKRT